LGRRDGRIDDDSDRAAIFAPGLLDRCDQELLPGPIRSPFDPDQFLAPVFVVIEGTC
jgi:hypothetical protein